MKRSFLSFLLLLSPALIFSQDLTGIWRGSFYNIREVLLGGSKYRYEVQIDNKGKSVKGVTYSYQTTRFYGKASMVGVWTPNTSDLILKEEKMEDMKIEGGGEGCLMTCYLEYHKEDDKEYFEGTYTSQNEKTGSNCGGGKVYLEKVPDTDFEKEDFLTKKDPSKNTGKIKPGQEDFLVDKKTPDSNKEKTDNVPAIKSTPPPVVKKPIPKIITQKPVAKAKPKPKPTPAVAVKPAAKASTNPSTASSAKKTVKPPPAKATAPSKKPEDVSRVPDATVKIVPPVVVEKTSPAPPPLVLKERQNELFQTIATSAHEISISFYDNGEIDGDIISVYDNNNLVVSRKGLTAQPITIKVLLNENQPEHEIVMVAENLGSIPPNTALMIVQAGDQRYNIGLSSNEQKNAMVRFKYEPGNEK